MVMKYLKFRELSIKSSYIKLGCDLYTRATYTHINMAHGQTIMKNAH